MQNIIGRKWSLAPCLGFKWVFLERKMHRWLFYPFQTMNIWRFICRSSKLWDVFGLLPSVQSEYLRIASDPLWVFERGWWLLRGAAVFWPATLRSSGPLSPRCQGRWFLRDSEIVLLIWTVLWFLCYYLVLGFHKITILFATKGCCNYQISLIHTNQLCCFPADIIMYKSQKPDSL